MTRSTTNIVICILLIAAGTLLVVRHWAHVPQFLPWLLILACPLMHLFGHRHHHSPEKHERQ